MLILVGVELLLRIVVTLSKNAITCFLELSLRSFCFTAVFKKVATFNTDFASRDVNRIH